MTTNYEKIKAMSIDEMAEFFGKIQGGEPCENCPILYFEEICSCITCANSFKQWLESVEEY